MKVGIITMYHNAYNYGAQLQARALTAVITNMGYYCEQIRYDASKESYPFKAKFINKILDKGLFLYIKEGVKNKVKYKIQDYKQIQILDKIEKRKRSFDNFAEETPHSRRIYNLDTIESCKDIYDIFITGSDQVFNPYYYNRAFLLEFVNTPKKLSYAASIGLESLNEKERELLRSRLTSFNMISVREKSGKRILSKLLPEPKITVDLDPTLLIEPLYWKRLAEYHQAEICEPYLFCYFLGDEKKLRDEAQRISKLLKLKLVTIKNAIGKYQAADSYDTIELIDDSPEGFNSAIANATFILTDSFHGTAFSIIHEKNFYVYKRNFSDKNSGDSRILDLLKELKIEDRWISNTLEYPPNKEDFRINYNMVNSRLAKLRNLSQEHLKCMIENSIVRQ